MTTLSTTEAHEQFFELLRRVASGKERIVLTRAGEDLVAVIPIEDLALVESLEDRADIEEAREALREAREKGTTSLADLKAEMGLSSEQAHRLRAGVARQDAQTVRASLPALLDKIAAGFRDAPALSDEAVSRAGIHADHP